MLPKGKLADIQRAERAYQLAHTTHPRKDGMCVCVLVCLYVCVFVCVVFACFVFCQRKKTMANLQAGY